MPRRDPLAYKYVGPANPDGTAAEFVMGVPSTDIRRSEFEVMTDDQKAALHASPLHRPYGAADEEAAAAEERLAKEAAAASPPEAVSVTVAGADQPRPRAEGGRKAP